MCRPRRPPVRDAMVLVAEQEDRALPGRLEPRQRDRVLGQLDRDDAPASRRAEVDPALLAGPSQCMQGRRAACRPSRAPRGSAACPAPPYRRRPRRRCAAACRGSRRRRPRAARRAGGPRRTAGGDGGRAGCRAPGTSRRSTRRGELPFIEHGGERYRHGPLSREAESDEGLAKAIVARGVKVRGGIETFALEGDTVVARVRFRQGRGHRHGGGRAPAMARRCASGSRPARRSACPTTASTRRRCSRGLAALPGAGDRRGRRIWTEGVRRVVRLLPPRARRDAMETGVHAGSGSREASLSDGTKASIAT